MVGLRGVSIQNGPELLVQVWLDLNTRTLGGGLKNDWVIEADRGGCRRTGYAKDEGTIQ